MSRPDRLTSSDVDQLSAMHCECLPNSLVSRIGPDYARAFYRYVASSEDELCFLHRDGEVVVSGCVISMKPHTLQRRLLTRTPLLLHVPKALLRLPLVPIARAAVRSILRQSDEPSQPPGPEILLIFTIPSARSTGIGAQTIGRCEEFLRSRGTERYFVKTLADKGNRAVAFYQRCGFNSLGAVTSNGKRLVLFAKDLHP